MNEILDSTINSHPHSPDHLADFYSNNAKWGTYESPRIHHESQFSINYPHYKAKLGFDDTSHHINEEANEIAQNHVEAYPGEIVSGENYLSKFIAPALYDENTPQSYGIEHGVRHNGRVKFHSHTGVENYHDYNAPATLINGGERLQGVHVARDNPARVDERRKDEDSSRRNEFYGQDGIKEDRPRQESEEQRFAERNNEKEAQYHNNEKERFHDDISNNNYHGNKNSDERQKDYNEREQTNKGEREEQRFHDERREGGEQYRVEEQRERPREGEQREFEEETREENNNNKENEKEDDDRDVHIENREQDTMVNMDDKINNIQVDKTAPYNRERPSEGEDFSEEEEHPSDSSYRGDSEDEGEHMRENAELTTHNKNNEGNSLENIGEQYSREGNEVSKFSSPTNPEISKLELADDRSMHSERADVNPFERMEENRIEGEEMSRYRQTEENGEQMNKQSAIEGSYIPEEQSQIREETGSRRSDYPNVSPSVSGTK